MNYCFTAFDFDEPVSTAPAEGKLEAFFIDVDVPGIGIHSNLRRRVRASNSAFVIVSGFSEAGSLHAVLLPSAGAESIHPSRISKNAFARNSVRYLRISGCIRSP